MKVPWAAMKSRAMYLFLFCFASLPRLFEVHLGDKNRVCRRCTPWRIDICILMRWLPQSGELTLLSPYIVTNFWWVWCKHLKSTSLANFEYTRRCYQLETPRFTLEPQNVLVVLVAVCEVAWLNSCCEVCFSAPWNSCHRCWGLPPCSFFLAQGLCSSPFPSENLDLTPLAILLPGGCCPSSGGYRVPSVHQGPEVQLTHFCLLQGEDHTQPSRLPGTRGFNPEPGSSGAVAASGHLTVRSGFGRGLHLSPLGQWGLLPASHAWSLWCRIELAQIQTIV